jgi:hypothetical protein
LPASASIFIPNDPSGTADQGRSLLTRKGQRYIRNYIAILTAARCEVNLRGDRFCGADIIHCGAKIVLLSSVGDLRMSSFIAIKLDI